MRHKGLTLLEVLFVLSLVVLLTSSILMVYLVAMRGWNSVGEVSALAEEVNFASERLSRDVRRANAMSVASHSLRFTVTENGSDQSYIYYLYHPSDSWVPRYDQELYQLRRAQLTGDLNGTFTYGDGEFILKGLRPPPNFTTVTGSSGLTTVHLVAKSGDEMYETRANIHPRNTT